VCPLACKWGATRKTFLVLVLRLPLLCQPFNMATPAMKFITVCANANLPLQTTKARQQTLLKDAGTTSSASLSTLILSSAPPPLIGCYTRLRTASLQRRGFQFLPRHSSTMSADCILFHLRNRALIPPRPTSIVSRKWSPSSCRTFAYHACCPTSLWLRHQHYSSAGCSGQSRTRSGCSAIDWRPGVNNATTNPPLESCDQAHVDDA
jgi:hypothetical protein